jgi:hypothetical protein
MAVIGAALEVHSPHERSVEREPIAALLGHRDGGFDQRAGLFAQVAARHRARELRGGERAQAELVRRQELQRLLGGFARAGQRLQLRVDVQHAGGAREHRAIAVLARDAGQLGRRALDLRPAVAARVRGDLIEQAHAQAHARAGDEVERFERVARVAHDVGDREHRGGGVGGGAAALHRDPQIAIGQRSVAVKRELARGDRLALHEAMTERVGDAQVQRALLARRERVVQDRALQLVAERERGQRAGRGDHDLIGDGLIDRQHQVARVAPQDHREQRQLEAAADHRCGLEHSARLRVELGDTLAQQLERRVGHFERLRARRFDAAQASRELGHEERVALALIEHGAAQAAVGIVEQRVDVDCDVLVLQALEGDALAVAVAEHARQVRLRRERRARACVAHGGDDQDACARDLVEQVAQELERSGVGAVQVFQHEQPRRLLGSGRERVRHRFEQLVALGVVVAGGRAAEVPASDLAQQP